MKRVVDVVVHEADRGFRGKKEKRWRPAICPNLLPEHLLYAFLNDGSLDPSTLQCMLL